MKMDPQDRDKIARNADRLIELTKWNAKLEAKLIERKVFTQNTFADTLSKESAAQKLKTMFDAVQRRGPKAFDGLIGCLVESGNVDAAKLLKPDLELPTGATTPRNSKVWNEPTYSKPEPLLLPTTTAEEPEMRDDKTPILVKVKKAETFKGPPNFKAYPMTKKIRGSALIIDNAEFENDVMPRREGSLVDANNLDILFEELGFKTQLKRNLAYNDLRTALRTFAESPSHADAEMCVVAILSHGENGLIFSSDGRQIPTEMVLAQFNNESCPALKGKPKFFILQACRGDDPDYGYVPRTDDTWTVEGYETSPDATAVFPNHAVNRTAAKDPTWEDMLIAYATIPGYVANRNVYRGTWFIESICDVFMRRSHELDIREMLDEVSENLRYYESEFGTKQSCSYEVRHFYKKLFFNPGLSKE